MTGSSAATGSASGLSDAGALTTQLLPVTRGLFDLAAIGAIGSTTALAWLVPWDRPDATRRLRAASAGWASAWCVAALAYLVCSAAQVVGVPVTRIFAAPDLLLYGVDLPQGRALLLVVVGSLSLALWISAARTRAVARAWALLAPALLAPLLATGHAATASNHFLATQTLLVHVLAVSLWMGGLLAVVLHLRGDRAALVVAVTRFSRLALLCFLAVAASGLVGAWTRLGLDPDVWRSDYGMLMIAKTALLGALAALGWAHRTYSLPALATGQRRVFARIAAVEVSLMTAALGLAVVLGRTAPPIAASLRAAPPHAAAFPTVDPTLPPLRPLPALLETRPDALVATFLRGRCRAARDLGTTRTGRRTADPVPGDVPGGGHRARRVGAGGRARRLLHRPAERAGGAGARPDDPGAGAAGQGPAVSPAVGARRPRPSASGRGAAAADQRRGAGGGGARRDVPDAAAGALPEQRARSPAGRPGCPCRRLPGGAAPGGRTLASRATGLRPVAARGRARVVRRADVAHHRPDGGWLVPRPGPGVGRRRCRPAVRRCRGAGLRGRTARARRRSARRGLDQLDEHAAGVLGVDEVDPACPAVPRRGASYSSRRPRSRRTARDLPRRR